MRASVSRSKLELLYFAERTRDSCTARVEAAVHQKQSAVAFFPGRGAWRRCSTDETHEPKFVASLHADNCYTSRGESRRCPRRQRFAIETNNRVARHTSNSPPGVISECVSRCRTREVGCRSRAPWGNEAM